jgi:gluconolactonase
MFPTPQPIKVREFTRLPERFRQLRRSAWGDSHRGGAHAHSFLEGPSFDRAGNLWLGDIPFGRVFRISPAGEWDCVAEYDGWPNGLKFHRDGRIFIADYRRGIMLLDPATGAVTPLVDSWRSEGFKGCNDLHFAADGALFFTDQGMTGRQDPSGRVFRRDADGRLSCLLTGVPSPNGLVLDLAEANLYLAVTRANAVWRVPLLADGTTFKVGTFIQFSGGVGPDGLALDEDGGIIVAQLGMTVWRCDRHGRPTHYLDVEPGGSLTNVACGGPERRTLHVVDSANGAVLVAEMPFPGRTVFGLS